MKRPTIEIAEWQTVVIQSICLSAVDRLVADAFAAEGGTRLVVEELRHGVRVSAKSWVGVVCFESFEVRVVPKLVGGNLRLTELIQIAAGIGCLKRVDRDRSLSTGQGNLFDLVAMLFVQSCETLLARGIIADYLEHEDDLPVLRGRFLAARQVLERFGQLDRIVCRFDDRQHDIWENQLLALAVLVASRRVLDPFVASRVRRLRSVFETLCQPTALDLRTLDANSLYNRVNRHYRDAHALARLIIDGDAVDDILQRGGTNCFAFLLDMNKLFEKFVARFLGKHLDSSRYWLRCQHGDRTVIRHADSGMPYGRAIPDFLVEERGEGGRRIGVDAKYKLYDDRKVEPGDLYQSFLYAQAFGVANAATEADAVLIYPSSIDSGSVLSLEICGDGGVRRALVRVVGLPIEGAIDDFVGVSRVPSIGRFIANIVGPVDRAPMRSK